jgi:outer membrane protein assembly factor BamB
VVVGTETGFIYVISGDSGRAKWKKKVGEDWVAEWGQLKHGGINDVVSLDAVTTNVVTSGYDGRVCLVDARAKDLVWEYRAIAREDSRGGPKIWLVPDVTGDGLPEILVGRGAVAQSGGSEREDTGRGGTNIGGAGSSIGSTPVTTSIQGPSDGSGQQLPPRNAVLLSGADGSEVWASEMYVTGSSIACVDGQPVLLEPHPQLGIRMVSLKDGSVIKSLKITTLDGKTPQARQLADGSYLVFSSGSDLAVISAAGTVQWCYPRVSLLSMPSRTFWSAPSPLNLPTSRQAPGW